jgi:Xaa-Pro aminopeptidase
MKIVKFFFIVLITISIHTFSQTPVDFLSKEFHKERRAILRSKMPKNSVSIVFANPERNRSNDVDYVYHQDPNFYYLTGYREPNGVLVIFSDDQIDEHNNAYNEILYVQKKDPKKEQWNGKRLGIKGAKNKLGFSKVFNGVEFIKSNINFQEFNKVFVRKFRDDYRNAFADQADIYDLIENFKQKSYYNEIVISKIKIDEFKELSFKPKMNIDTSFLNKNLAAMREIKTNEELKLLTKAIRISAVGQIEVMKAMKPHMSETELQGIHEFVYKKYGAEYEGYPSIVGAGNNGCILHYIENSKTKVGNNLVLMDLGAEYRGYTADVTRTIPANGKFTKEQKAIYDIVYKAQEAGIKASIVGAGFRAPNTACKTEINKGLFELGIIKSIQEKHNYLPHGVSHYLGLDVHDPGTYGVFRANSVITVEPGIYIPEGSPCDKKWWGIAVRIEDDILITEKGPVNLSAEAPRKSDEIEKMMAKKSVLDEFVLPNLDK